MADVYSSLTLFLLFIPFQTPSLQTLSSKEFIQLFIPVTQSATQITFIWIPGHIGVPEHDAVDKATKQATSSPKITHFARLSISDLKNHYRSLILQQWNSFWKTQPSNKLLLIKKIPCPWSSSTGDSSHSHSLENRSFPRHSLLSTRPFHLITSFMLSRPRRKPISFHFFFCPQLQSLHSSLNVPPPHPQALTNNSDTITLSSQHLRLPKFFSLIQLSFCNFSIPVELVIYVHNLYSS